jgi:hypothetical protein
MEDLAWMDVIINADVAEMECNRVLVLHFILLASGLYPQPDIRKIRQWTKPRKIVIKNE